MRPFLLTAVAVLITVVAGCAGLAGLDESPRVSLAAIRPTQVGLLEQRYAAMLRIQNPNNTALVIEGLDYTIHLNDRKFASGLSNQVVEVPPFGEQTVEVSMVSTLLTLLQQLREIDDGMLKYSLSGRAALKGVPGTISFTHDGELDVNALLKPPRSA